MAEILLCRHGFTPSNNANRNQQSGIREVIRYDELCPLEKHYGKQQAEEMGEFLADRYKNKKILVCYSPYYRTRETMHHVLKHLDKDNQIDTKCIPAIREINQGLTYAKSRKMYAEDDWEIQNFFDFQNANKVPSQYPQGESELDVRRRVNHYARQLRDYRETSTFDDKEYDAVVVITHETVAKSIYYAMFRRPLEVRQTTASVLRVDESPELVFAPKTNVPDGFNVDFAEYNDYFRLRNFYDKMRDLKSDIKFHAFFGGHINMPLVEETKTYENMGESITMLPNGTDSRGMYLVDSNMDFNEPTCNNLSKSTFYVLDGDGTFDIDKKSINVSAGDVVVVPRNSVCSYKGKMLLVQKMEPNLQLDKRNDFGIKNSVEEKEFGDR